MKATLFVEGLVQESFLFAAGHFFRKTVKFTACAD